MRIISIISLNIMKNNSTKTTSVISTIWPLKKWANPWCPISKNLKKLLNINKINPLQLLYSQLNNLSIILLNKKNSMTKTTSLTSMIWPHKKWETPWSPTITIISKHNMEKLNKKINKKTNTSHPSKTNLFKSIKLMRVTILMLSTAWLSKKWTAPWSQTNKTRM